MTGNKLILPYPHLRAAQIFARSQKSFLDPHYKSEVIIDTDGSIYGVSESYVYRTPAKYACLAGGELTQPISLSMPTAMLPNWVSSVSINLPADITNMQYTLMMGHGTDGNPLEDCWTGIAICNASDDSFYKPLQTLDAAKALIAKHTNEQNMNQSEWQYMPVDAGIGISPRMLSILIEALDLHPSVLPSEYRQLNMSFSGAASPIKIDLGAIDGTLLTMPASADLIKNDASELE